MNPGRLTNQAEPGIEEALRPLSPFARRVLTLLREVPPGRVTTYGMLAARAGRPAAARAVGAILHRNPLPLRIPCHRVVRADGSLGGYAGGSGLKQRLLEREGVPVDDRQRVPPHLLHALERDRSGRTRKGA